ncbi:MAG: serine dehydratase subunit alpha family protein [Desulfovibrio sp.]|uniref:L-cysteine desulfidase family protein n=1 Tax=Desulfovibrio sp. 7SRBS1 TaxID=3378064 RepID=UPI003B405511
MNKQRNEAFVRLLQDELVPATGCTEPIAIAYCAAKAVEVLGAFPESMVVELSGNMIKNAMGVTVPNSGGLKGIDVAAVLGAVGGDADKGLQVLEPVGEKEIARTNELLAQKDFCTCKLIENVDNLFIIVSVRAGEHQATVEIQTKHTNITRMEKDGQVLYAAQTTEETSEACGEESDATLKLLTLESIVQFADEADLDDVRDILQRQLTYNRAISEKGLQEKWGVNVGRTMLATCADMDSVKRRAIAAAAAGSDARMSGCPLPVVINSGSGNQGMTISLPIAVYAEAYDVPEEKALRALALADLIAIHQKQYIGDLSAYCGTVCAATAAVCGIAYMNGDGLDVLAGIITNSICTIGGMVCDGAKPSCAAKISVALEAAFRAYELEKGGLEFLPGEGLVKNNVEATIQSVGQMARCGMRQTDLEILNIMLEH